jgi:hypothetical protein
MNSIASYAACCTCSAHAVILALVCVSHTKEQYGVMTRVKQLGTACSGGRVPLWAGCKQACVLCCGAAVVLRPALALSHVQARMLWREQHAHRHSTGVPMRAQLCSHLRDRCSSKQAGELTTKHRSVELADVKHIRAGCSMHAMLDLHATSVCLVSICMHTSHMSCIATALQLLDAFADTDSQSCAMPT